MTFFSDQQQFNPERDGKVPLRRDPLALVGRFIQLMLSLLFSRHPLDLWRWFRSMQCRGRPLRYVLPWLTFGATRAISKQIMPGSSVFEFGSGHSTLYWAEQGCHVQAVEDDACWYEMLAPRIVVYDGCEVHLRQSNQDYVDEIAKHGQRYDVVLVDGSYRLECIAPALAHLKPGGLLVVDNTDWHWFDDVDELIPADWEKQSYSGWAPFIGHRSETTVWTKPK